MSVVYSKECRDQWYRKRHSYRVDLVNRYRRHRYHLINRCKPSKVRFLCYGAFYKLIGTILQDDLKEDGTEFV